MGILGSFGGSRGYGRVGVFVPPKPTIVSVTDVGTDRPYNNGALSVTVSPDPSGPTPDFYNAWALDPEGTKFFSSGSTSNTTFTIPYLNSNVQYTVEVVAVFNFVASQPATYTTPTLVTTVPAAPTIGTATDVGTGRALDDAAAVVTFTAGVSGGKSITSYKVYTSDGIQRGTGSSSPVLAEGLDIEYQNDFSFRVAAVNENGESQVSSSTSSTTLTSTPGGPSLTLNSVSNNTVNFTYSTPNTGGKTISSVRVYVMSDGSEMGTSTFLSASGTESVTISGNPGTSSFLWSQATNANGAGGFGLSGTQMSRADLATLTPSRTGSSTGTVTIGNYNASYTYYVSTSSGTASRSAGTISITGASSDAFTVTVVVNEGGEFKLNSLATATVPEFVAPPPFFPPYFPIVLGRCTSAQVVAGCFSTSACCDGGAGEACSPATSGCDF
jgi:hypothetical protein